MQNIIEVRNLKKSYGAVEAVRGIDFSVRSGSFFAFLGPNGAGKSTTIDILCTFLKKDSGEVIIDGHRDDDDAVRRTIGVVFQDSLLDKLLTVRENLRIRGAFYGLSGRGMQNAVDRAVAATGIGEFLDRRVGTLSGGQRRRSDIARALLHRPKLLILDEPTTGLDPGTRKSVWETVRTLQKEAGTTVFLTTHYMEEAAGSDMVNVIHRGQIVAAGTPAQLRENYSSDHLVMTARDDAALGAVLGRLGILYESAAGAFHVKLDRTMDALPILDAVRPHLDIFEVKCGNLDEAFVNIIGESPEPGSREAS